MPETMKCALCDHEPACGFATVTVGDRAVRLCHADTHVSCYKLWTVYGRRPATETVSFKGFCALCGVYTKAEMTQLGETALPITEFKPRCLRCGFAPITTFPQSVTVSE